MSYGRLCQIDDGQFYWPSLFSTRDMGEPGMKSRLSCFCLGLMFLGLLPGAQASVYTQTWAGALVEIIYPEKVTYNTAFDVSLSVDSSTLSGDAIAFTTLLNLSNTVNLAGASWEYAFYSDDSSWNWNFSGALGDANTPLVSTSAGHSISFNDPVPYYPPYTWLWSGYNDKVTWTIRDMVILADTDFSWRLDDLGIVGGPITGGFTVLDPPAVTVAQIPAPGTLLLALLGFSLLVAVRRPRR